jgi:hypothetical protein
MPSAVLCGNFIPTGGIGDTGRVAIVTPAKFLNANSATFVIQRIVYADGSFTSGDNIQFSLNSK